MSSMVEETRIYTGVKDVSEANYLKFDNMYSDSKVLQARSEGTPYVVEYTTFSLTGTNFPVAIGYVSVSRTSRATNNSIMPYIELLDTPIYYDREVGIYVSLYASTEEITIQYYNHTDEQVTFISKVLGFTEEGNL